MIRDQNLDIRTITMGISLHDCVCEDGARLAEKIYDKVTKTAEKLCPVGEEIEKIYGIPIVNKRVSVTPISQVTGGIRPERGTVSHPYTATRRQVNDQERKRARRTTA